MVVTISCTKLKSSVEECVESMMSATDGLCGVEFGLSDNDEVCSRVSDLLKLLMLRIDGLWNGRIVNFIYMCGFFYLDSFGGWISCIVGESIFGFRVGWRFTRLECWFVSTVFGVLNEHPRSIVWFLEGLRV